MELFIACLKAFLVGGAICCLAELLIDKTGLTPARILTLCVVLGAARGRGAQDFADQLRSRLPHADVRVFFEEG